MALLRQMGRVLFFLFAIVGDPVMAASGSSVRAEDLRVAKVAFRLVSVGKPYCDPSYPLTGLQLHFLAEYAPADRDEAIRLYRLDRGPGILAIVDESPAAAAGLIAGDILLAVNNQPLPDPLATAGDSARELRRAVEAAAAVLEDQLRHGPVQLTIDRAGKTYHLMLGSIPGCAARARLARSNQFNAFANRGYAVVTTRLLDFMQSDDDLAIALGHELAHVILGHPEALKSEGVPRGILRHFGTNAARVRATEEDADRLGLKLAWAAGYDIGVAIPFWRRFHAKVGPRVTTTHPGPKAREKLIADTIRELAAASKARVSD